MDDFYALLGLSPSASGDVIKSEIAQAQRMWMHRANLPELKRRQEAERKVDQLRKAKAVLLDPRKRADYDRELAAANQQPTLTPAVAPVPTAPPQHFAPPPQPYLPAPPQQAPLWHPPPQYQSPVPAYQYVPAAPVGMPSSPSNTLLTIALVLSVMGILCPGGIFSIGGIVLGLIVRNQVARTGGKSAGATTAIVLSGIGLVFFVIFTISRLAG
ncbi:DnaJ domain-containing protein [Nocardia salmonicida]|uniref:DnaJ domain-containing protein n=1 Tax=Nocardia salmonicida TaxID=53431 RepID=UPI00364C5F90